MTVIGIALLGSIAWQCYQIRMLLKRHGVQTSVPAFEQPTVTSWLATDALQAAQEQQQTKAANKIANAVKWR